MHEGDVAQRAQQAYRLGVLPVVQQLRGRGASEGGCVGGRWGEGDVTLAPSLAWLGQLLLT